MSRLLIVDDEPAIRESLSRGLAEQGHSVEAVATAADALRVTTSEDKFDAVLLDIGLPDRSGLDVLADLRKKCGETPIIVVSADTEMKSTIRAMRDGAFDFVSKPVDPDELDKRIARALAIAAGRAAAAAPSPPLPKADQPDEMIGTSRAMREVFKLLGLLAASRTTVLIRGESGTGKELAARILHEASQKNGEDLPFVAVNCAALPGPLVEAEIFGHRRGAYTGADRDRPGKLEAAGEGTFFLDEVGEVPLETQVKLLRVLQERQYERLGETESRPFRARVITATHRNLEEMVEAGTFREDLYFRLNVATVTLPPLRARPEDIPLMVDRLLQAVAKEVGRPIQGVSPSAIELLRSHDWPGNVRELRNVLTRAAVQCRGTLITEADLEVGSRREHRVAPEPAAPSGDSERPPTLEEAEKELIRRALAYTHGHRGKTCAVLGTSRPTLLRKIKRYGLDKPA